MPGPAPRRAHLVSHTHWDREWYLSYPRFRVQLLETVDQVLDQLERDPEFRHFCLDGQTLALRDYLEARPDQAPRVRRLAEQGALGLGPWYVLPDEILVSGEATVRNLQLGRADSLRWGAGAQPVGYLPDTFGHLAQMPQILQQAGIDSFIYWRGHGDEHARLGLEWWWEAPDRSRVLAINQEDGYVNAAALGHAELWHAHTRRDLDPAVAVDKVGRLFARMAARSRTGTWLLNNGCDHHPPQRRFGEMLAALRAAFPDTAFSHGSFAEYLAAVRDELPADLPVWSGELLGGKAALILSGVWSTRLNLKQQNAACQDLLAHQLEPLLAYGHFIHRLPHRTGLVDHCWRELLKNHPHDSICGCSIDQVHRDMLTRFAEVRETGEHLAGRTLEHLAPGFGPGEADDRDTLVVVANPLPWRRDEVVDRLVILQPLGYDLDHLRLVGPDGRDVPFVIKSRRFLQRFWGIDYRAELRAADQLARMHGYLEAFPTRIVKTEADRDTELVDCFLELQFLARGLPACGHAAYRLTDRPAGPAAPASGFAPPPADLVRADGPVLQNARLRVTLHPDGALDLVDRLTGLEFRGLGRLEDTEDAGDEYDWSPAADSLTLTSAGARGTVTLTEDTGLAATLVARFTWPLPRGLTADRTGRSRELVDMPVTVSVRLTAADDVADVTVVLDNTARDHRLRAVFPAGVHTDTVTSDGQFLLTERPLAPPAGRDWEQPHPGTYPQQDFSYICDAGGRGLAIVADGLPEIAPRREPDRSATLALTLLRAVGWLSRDDLPTRRRANAGPTIPTPDAQLLGPHTVRYALAPLSAGPRDLRRRARGWLRPSFTRQAVETGAAPGGSLLAQRNPEVAVSAIRRHPDRGTLVVRLWNQTGIAQADLLTTGLPVAQAWLLDLLEERQETLPLAVMPTHEVPVHLLPHRIVTVELGFDPPQPPGAS
ncbi:MAG: glycoside hydrolase family 38 C-terminal domain-containing protein [Candidatus Krumholzibacteriia bacterium]